MEAAAVNRIPLLFAAGATFVASAVAWHAFPHVGLALLALAVLLAGLAFR